MKIACYLYVFRADVAHQVQTWLRHQPHDEKQEKQQQGSQQPIDQHGGWTEGSSVPIGLQEGGFLIRGLLLLGGQTGK